jgi:hypothetical protein
VHAVIKINIEYVRSACDEQIKGRIAYWILLSELVLIGVFADPEYISFLAIIPLD